MSSRPLQDALDERYQGDDQDFKRFWLSHCRGGIVLPPLKGVSFETAYLIWEAAKGTIRTAEPIRK